MAIAETEGTEANMAAMIDIIGPNGGKYIVAFRTADGRSMGLLVSAAQAEVLGEIQEKIPYGLAVPDLDDAPITVESCAAAKTPYRYEG
jgi:hypothetical protein